MTSDVSNATRRALAMLAVLTIDTATSTSIAARQTSPAKVCALLPIQELEALYGSRAGVPRGTDTSTISSCTVIIANQAVKVSSSPPGTPDEPKTVKMGLKALTAMVNDATGQIKPEQKDYGTVGCSRITITNDFRNKPLDKPVGSTTCFQLDGGYLSLTLTSDDPSIISDQRVMALLAKTADRRKGGSGDVPFPRRPL